MNSTDDAERKAISCLVQHFETFRWQAGHYQQASFGEACEKCQHIGECDVDWLSIIAPVLGKSDVKIHAVWPED